jgi:hypothetical protein
VDEAVAGATSDAEVYAYNEVAALFDRLAVSFAVAAAMAQGEVPFRVSQIVGEMVAHVCTLTQDRAMRVTLPAGLPPSTSIHLLFSCWLSDGTFALGATNCTSLALGSGPLVVTQSAPAVPLLPTSSVYAP